MPPTLVFRVRGVLDGVEYVSDGAILVRSDLVQPSADPAGVREIQSIQIRGMLATLGTRRTTLDALVPSKMGAAFRTSDEVALGEKYIALLRALDGPLELVTHTVTSPVVISMGGVAIGALMPMNLAPEVGALLPPPSGGAIRGRIVSYARERGFAVVRLPDGRDVTLDVAAMAGSLANLAQEHALVDLEVAEAADGTVRGTFAWLAGTRDPRPAPAPRAPAAGPFDAKALLGHFAASIAASGSIVKQVGSLDYPAHHETPSFTIHVLERVFGERREGSFFVVTNGLSQTALPGGGQGVTLSRFELVTWTTAHDLKLLDTIASVGTALHAMAARGSRFALGHSISTGAPGFMGWPRVMLSRMSRPLELAHGAVDVARVTPITNEEWAEKQALFPDDIMGGYPYVTTLEHRGFDELLARWHTPPPWK